MIKIYNNNCIDVMRSISNSSIDLSIIDPPYKMTPRGRSCTPNVFKNNIKSCLFDDRPADPNLWIPEIYRVMKTGHVYIFTNNISMLEYMNIAEKVGFKLHNILTMVKDTHMPSRWYMNKSEFVLFYRKGKAIPINNHSSTNIINVHMPRKNKGKIHITQKPESIIDIFIKNSSKAGDIILDPFSGSGTVGVCADRLNRDSILIEKNVDNFNIAKQRLTEAGGRGIEVYE